MSDVISLSKGETISLSKHPAISLGKNGLRNAMIGLGWAEANADTGEKKGLLQKLFGAGTERKEEIDCDAFAALVTDEKYVKKSDIVYYHNLEVRDGVLRHSGDNLTGGDKGDCELIYIDLAQIPSDINTVLIGVHIYRGVSKGQHFGMLRNAFIRIANQDTNIELCRFELDSKYDKSIAILFGKLVRTGGEWQFTALGEVLSDNSRDTYIPDSINSYISVR